MKIMKIGFRQRGVGLISLLFACALIGFFALIAAKLFPLYLESLKVDAVMTAVASMPDVGMKGDQELETSILRRFEVEEVNRFTEGNIKDHLQIKKNEEGNSRTMTMTYENRRPLFGNLDVVLKFNKSVTVPGTGPIE